jgi:hypothetical protein
MVQRSSWLVFKGRTSSHLAFQGVDKLLGGILKA